MAQLQPLWVASLGVSPTRVPLHSPLIFLDAAWLLLILRRTRPHIGEAYSLSQTAIIISIDGFSVPSSISCPNYTVERSAVANNQINEFGYLESIIAYPAAHAQ